MEFASLPPPPSFCYSTSSANCRRSVRLSSLPTPPPARRQRLAALRSGQRPSYVCVDQSSQACLIRAKPRDPPSPPRGGPNPPIPHCRRCLTAAKQSPLSYPPPLPPPPSRLSPPPSSPPRAPVTCQLKLSAATRSPRHRPTTVDRRPTTATVARADDRLARPTHYATSMCGVICGSSPIRRITQPAAERAGQTRSPSKPAVSAAKHARDRPPPNRRRPLQPPQSTPAAKSQVTRPPGLSGSTGQAG